MVFTKKPFISILLAATVGASSTITNTAGKIESLTTEEVTHAIETTVKYAEETLEALNNGADKDVILDLIRKTKQIAKEIEVTRLGPNKMKASAQMKKARFAVRKDEMDKAKKHVKKGVSYYHALRKRFYDF